MYHERKDKGDMSLFPQKIYMAYTDALFGYICYMPFIGGTIGLNIKNGIERYGQLHYLNYKPKLMPAIFSNIDIKTDKTISGIKIKTDKTAGKMIDQMEKKYPLIFSVGPGGYLVTEKDKVKMKKRVSDSLITFEDTYQHLYDHYVTLTGIIINKYENSITLQISSWGEKYYVDYNDICTYVKKFKNALFCDAIIVDDKK